MADREKSPRVYDFWLLTRVLSAFEEELQRRDPQAYREACHGEGTFEAINRLNIRVNGRTVYEAYDEYVHALNQRPPLRIRPGDYVRINGRVFVVGEVDVRRRRVSLERPTRDGRTVSAVWCDAEDKSGRLLEPLPNPGEALGDWPPYPAELTDGLARAKFNLREHENHLVGSGFRLWCDDD